MVSDVYERYSAERKAGQENGTVPEWMTTAGYQFLKEKYLHAGETPRDRYHDIAYTLSVIGADMIGTTQEYLYERFFNLLWKGFLSPSTPVLANVSSKFVKGCSVSCSGGYVHDSVRGFYNARTECAILSQEGFGTSSYLGDIRPRGSSISRGGKATGVLPVLKGFVQDTRDVSQGSTRRGAWAGYLEADGGDFWECINYVAANHADLNVGWCLDDNFEKRLDEGDPEALARWKRIMKVRAVTGKGYLFFPHKANAQSPQMYKDLGLEVKASNLCTEIMLHSSPSYTFTCVLASLNLTKWDEFEEDTIVLATMFLDCVAELFIRQGRNIPGLEKAVAFTEKGRALGLGVLGFHSYLQSKRVPLESLDAHFINIEIFKKINEDTLRASQTMAVLAGEPEWCKGYGVRNTHRMAIAPTLSTATICGGVSQGIEPFFANVFAQGSAAGGMFRINPELIPIMKERGVYNAETIKRIGDNKGSVQQESWLDDHEKLVFRTAFEINQEVLIRLASARQRFIDQGQSLNLFFDADEDEEYISYIHKLAYKDPYIKSVYYMRSLAGVQASKGECIACE